MKSQKPTNKPLKIRMSKNGKVKKTSRGAVNDTVAAEERMIISRLRDTERKLSDSEQRYRSFLDSNPLAVFCLDIESRITVANQAAVDLSGYTQNELCKMKCRDLCSPEDIKETGLHLKACFKGETSEWQTELIRKDGRPVKVSLNGHPVIIGDEIQEIFLSAWDVTQLKETEENLRTHQTELQQQNDELRIIQEKLIETRDRYLELYEYAPVGYLTLNDRGIVLQLNRMASLLFGRERDEITGRRLEKFVVPDDRDACYLHLRKAAADHEKTQTELRFLRGFGGSFFWAVVQSLPVDETGSKGQTFRTTIIDVTDRGTSEMKLQLNEERLRLAVQGGGLGVWDRNYLTGRVEWNSQMYRMLGRDPGRAAVLNETIFEYIHEADRKRVAKHLEKAHQTGKIFHDEFRIVREDGEVRWLNASGRVYRNSKGEAVRMTGVNFDITERKRAEEQLRSSRLQFQTLAEHSPDIIARFDRQMRHIYINQSISRYSGIPADQYIHKTHRDMGMPPYLRDLWEEGLSRVFETGKTKRFEFEFQKGDLLYFLQTDLTPEFGTAGSPESVLAVTRDITSIREAEAVVRKERDLLHVIMENTATYLAYLDREFNFLIVNEAYVKGCGYGREALLGRNHFDLFPDAENQAIFEQVRDTGEPVVYEARPFQFPDDPGRGVTYWNWSLTPVKSGDNQVTGLVLSLTEVTESQRTSQERELFIDEIQALSRNLKIQAAELEAIIGSLADPVLVFDIRGVIIRANAAANTVMGRNPVSIEDRNVLNNLLLPMGCASPCPEHLIVINRALSGEVIKDEVCLFQNSRGQNRYVLVSAASIRDSYELKGTVVTWHDISDRLQKEELLYASEQRYMLAQQLAGIGSWDWNIRTGHVQLSETIIRLLGLENKRFDQNYLRLLRYVCPQDRKHFTEAVNTCIEEGVPFNVEHRVVWPDHTVHWIRQSGNVIRNENRLAIRMMGMVQDITAQKKAAENQYLLAEIVSESGDAIVVRNPDNFITAWNAGAENIYGYSAKEMIGQKMDRILPPERLQEHAQMLRRTQAGEHIRHFETERIRKDGNTIHVAISFSPLRNESRAVFAIATIEHDITPRVQAARVLLEAKQTLETRVDERTRELQIANKELAKQIRQRNRYQKRLMSLTAELIRSEERQRREIATSLHDSVIQLLVLSNIRLDQIINTRTSGSKKKIMNQIHEYLDKCIHELRSMTFQISPPVLYELGLIPALEWLAEQFTQEHGFTCQFQDDGKEKPLVEEIRNMLFQAVQELLINVVKHAGATRAEIQVKKRKKQILITIKDNGRGFDATRLRINRKHYSGFGLFNIEERIRFMKGQFQIQSEVDNGTIVQLRAPLNL